MHAKFRTSTRLPIALIIVSALLTFTAPLIATDSSSSSGFVAGPAFANTPITAKSAATASQTGRPPGSPFPQFAKPPKAEVMQLPLAINGQAPVISRVPTKQPVAFITIDDGYLRRESMAELLQEANIPASSFLISHVVAAEPEVFRRMQTNGMTIQNHTVTHQNLRGLPYENQYSEICAAADQLADMFGKRPTLLRPPNGEYDEITLRAAHDCGMKAVVMWEESVGDGRITYPYPYLDNTIRSGDIILMHFRESFAEDLTAILNAIKAAGLTPALLDDYLE